MQGLTPPSLHMPAATLAPLEAVLDPAYPEAWREIATSLYLGLRGCSALQPAVAGDDAQVAGLALRLTEDLRQEIGGSQPYLPQGNAFELSLRDRQIAAEWNGRNRHQLARKHGLTERRLHQILDAWQREQFARRQHSLDLDGA